MKTPLDFQVYGIVTVTGDRAIALASAQTDEILREFGEIDLLEKLEPETLIFASQIYPRSKIVLQPIGERAETIAGTDPQVRELVASLVKRIARRL